MAQRGPCFSSCCKAAQGQGVAGAGAARCGWPGTGKSCRPVPPVPLLPSPPLPSSRLLPGPLRVADGQALPDQPPGRQLWAARRGGPGPEAPGGLLLAWGAQPSPASGFSSLEHSWLPCSPALSLRVCSSPPLLVKPCTAGGTKSRARVPQGVSGPRLEFKTLQCHIRVFFMSLFLTCFSLH